MVGQATSNKMLRETFSLEFSFVNSNLQLLKEQRTCRSRQLGRGLPGIYRRPLQARQMNTWKPEAVAELCDLGLSAMRSETTPASFVLRVLLSAILPSDNFVLVVVVAEKVVVVVVVEEVEVVELVESATGSAFRAGDGILSGAQFALNAGTQFSIESSRSLTDILHAVGIGGYSGEGWGGGDKGGGRDWKCPFCQSFNPLGRITCVICKQIRIFNKTEIQIFKSAKKNKKDKKKANAALSTALSAALVAAVPAAAAGLSAAAAALPADDFVESSSSFNSPTPMDITPPVAPRSVGTLDHL
ncbi:hypothetical protein DAPPUDRAFT_257511 [Daphnia pulex]|uniref:RanBP2-type domain-containing protein n=1 Tax=Daphnia pulex TaxID=6669 RepID=E9HDQ6_DAPPU|nr:hypothetical protein DAPPUDRAFT_257511 [Daphnia pulex]|eukprot:EFX70131.1 hypothetical protein DAPPUDRAFT_257511 [Daphnia pulex]